MRALQGIEAEYFSDDIDPATGIERTHPVSPAHIRSTHIMVLVSKFGFVDLFDHVPGLLNEKAEALFSSSIESNGLEYVALDWLRKMKMAAGRNKDKDDLEQLGK